jgi:precorrin-6A/cobalt-precorrin-6A reductase
MTAVLVLAGTTEAAALVHRLVGHDDLEVIASYAGRVREPRPLPCATRVGGFGGVDGLATWLREAGTDLLVDATHPFALHMPTNAVEAARRAGIEHVRLRRAPWTRQEGDDWHDVDDLDEAARWLRGSGCRRAFLATGSGGLDAFADLTGVGLVVRAVDEPPGLPAGATVVRARGPFDLAAERALLLEHGVEVVVARNSGGDATAAKLVAARELGLPVVLVRPPPPPEGAVVATVDDAEAWVLDRARA